VKIEPKGSWAPSVLRLSQMHAHSESLEGLLKGYSDVNMVEREGLHGRDEWFPGLCSDTLIPTSHVRAEEEFSAVITRILEPTYSPSREGRILKGELLELSTHQDKLMYTSASITLLEVGSDSVMQKDTRSI
jgi:hypothetical protein